MTRVTRGYNAFQLFAGLLWWLPIFYVSQSRAGLSDEEIFAIQGVFYLAFCLLDIPTGALADRFDYRKPLIGGAAALVVANLVPVFFASFSGFLVHFLLIALAHSLISGAGSAYLYEYLHRSGHGEHYQQAEGKARAYTLAGRVACLPAAGFLFEWHATAPYLLSAAGCAVAVVVAYRLPGLPAPLASKEGMEPRESIRVALAGAFRSLLRSRALILLMVQGTAVFTLIRLGQANLFQPILELKSVPLIWFGGIMALSALFEMLGATRSKLLRRFGDLKTILTLTVLMAVALALTVPMGQVATIVCFFAFSLTSGLVFPIQKKLVNRAIDDPSRRATLLSIESLADRAVCAIVVFALSGFLAGGAMSAFLISFAVAIAVSMAVLAVLIHRTPTGRAPVVEKAVST